MCTAQRRVQCSRFTGILVALSLAMTTICAADPPRVWTWSPPQGSAAAHPAFVPLCRVAVGPTSSPTGKADEVRNLVAQRGLGDGEVAILLQNYGRGTLVGNPLDALDAPHLPPTVIAGTPWTANGVMETAAWTSTFITRLQSRLSKDGLPSPSRFHMDSELRLPALCYLPEVDDCWSTTPLEVFAAMQSDPRWEIEPLRMNPLAGPEGRTMAQLHADAGSPRFDVSQPRDAEVNRTWSRWWDGLMREAVDGALATVLYEPVLMAWPDAKCSEFAQSMRLDGGIEPDGSRREFVDFEWWNRGWMTSQWRGRASLQAPTLYVFGESFIDTEVSFMDEQMRLHRSNLDACLHSFGGVTPSEVTPWLTLPRQWLPYGESPYTVRAYTDDEFLRMVALLKGRGIEEFLLWPGATADVWTAAANAIDAVWTTTLTGAEIAAGVVEGDPIATMSTCDRVPCVLRSEGGGVDLRIFSQVEPPPPCLHRCRTWIALEVGAAGAAIGEIEYRRLDGSWSPVSTLMIETPHASPHWIGPVDTADAVLESGIIEWRVRSRSDTTISIDLFQVAHESAILGDLDDDGTVGGGDLGIWLSQAGTTCASSTACPADLDGDGEIRGGDLGLLLANWGACDSSP